MKSIRRIGFIMIMAAILLLVLSVACWGVVPPTFDKAFIKQSATSGYGLYVYRNLASTSTTLPLAYFYQDHATDDQAALAVKQDAAAVPAIDIVGAIGIKHGFDAAAYWTATVADGGGVTFDSTSDGTPGFTFPDAVILSSTATIAGLTRLGANGTGADLQLYTDVAGSNLLWDASDNTLEGTGSAYIKIGDTTTGVVTAGGSTMIFGEGIQKTAALTGELIGVKGNARVSIDSTGSTAGGYFLAGNGAADDIGYELAAMRGVYAGVTSKAPADATATIGIARGYEVSMDLDQGTLGHAVTITDAQMFYGVYNAPTVGTYATITNGYGVFLRNEAVGGTGQALDAALYVDDRSMSGAVHGWDYGIDFSGIGANSGNFGTADIRLANGETISNTDDGVVALSAASVKVNSMPVVLNTRHRVTTAEANAGHEILPAIAGRTYRVVDCKMIAYGDAAATCTTVDILGTQSASSVKLVAFAQASLTQSAVLTAGGTGAAVLADGASFVACDANTAITIGVTTNNLATATGVDVILDYVIE